MSSQMMYYAAWVFLVIAILLAIFLLLCGCGSSSCGSSSSWGSSSGWRDAVTFFFALAIALALLALYQYGLDVRFDQYVNQTIGAAPA